MNLNRVIIAGNLTRDPEVKYTPSGTAVCQVGLAINNSYTKADGQKVEETTFVDVTLWGKPAEIVGEHCRKGKQMLFEGRLKTDSWEDKETGKKRSKMNVVADSFQFVGPRETTERQERPPSRPSQPVRDLRREPKPQEYNAALDSKEEDESIPF